MFNNNKKLLYRNSKYFLIRVNYNQHWNQQKTQIYNSNKDSFYTNLNLRLILIFPSKDNNLINNKYKQL